MVELNGYEAFSALARLLKSEVAAEDWKAISPAIDRLRQALVDRSNIASELDLAVMLRQAMTYEHMRRGNSIALEIQVAHARLNGFSDWDKVGLRATRSDNIQVITYRPWEPEWLGSVKEGVDAFAASEVTRREFNTSECKGDPFLASVKRTSYRSRGQRAAVRAALSTPPGGSLVVALPTGEGKSMIFQLIHTVGFVAPDQAQTGGVTLVIVPTVALGVNHEQEAANILGLSPPLAFQSGNDVENSLIAERIANGSQGLCFASPEAACGSLRTSLRAAADAGLLRALVIDEAHLVDQWGIGFRTEFQELSGLRRELLSAAPAGQELRTIMLSATLTESSTQTLSLLFGGEDNFESLAAVQLRSEPDYWIAATTSDSVRRDQILEALHHVPRPVVLYVTKVDDADAWYQELTSAGFRRVRKLHGRTSRAEREQIVGQWRNGELDIVVGTSAFGLGIDYPHARSVIHACVPENLDRFYQEVGRGGRDGKASLSLIIPTKGDFAIAKEINKKQLIGIERGHERWAAMFERKKRLNSGRFAVRIDGRPGNSEHDIDMFGDRNTDWNSRTLVLMSRAGLLRLLGTPYPRIEEPGIWREIEIIDDEHLDKAIWRTRVEAARSVISNASERNLALMRAFLLDDQCPATVLEDLYGASRLGRSCSRCRKCRLDAKCKLTTIPVGEPLAPWTAPLEPLVAELFDNDLRLLVTYDPDSLPRNATRRLGATLQRLQQAHVAKLITLGAQPFDMTRLLNFAENSAFFVSDLSSLALSRLPKGPEIVMVGDRQKLTPQNLTPRSDNPRIFLTSLHQSAPDGRRLHNVFGGRTLTLDEFNARVAQ